MICRWLGTVEYGEALQAQRAHREALIAGEAGPEIWLLEHPPVVTTGRRGVDDLVPSRIASAGYALYTTERGGLATCHEPGQLVAYVLIDARAIGVWRTVAAVERTIADWLGEQGVHAGPREGYPGVWVGRDKICAVGLHFRAGRTMHGLALNLTNDLRGFGLITPCGIRDGGVTSLSRLLGGDALTPARVSSRVGEKLAQALLDATSGPVRRGGPEGT